MDPFLVGIYKNGIVLQGFPFAPFGSDTCQVEYEKIEK